MKTILLLSGPPASGKSTVGQLLAERLEPSLHLKVDDLRHMMVRGLRVPRVGESWTEEVTDQFRWARDCAAFMAERYAREGVRVVVDDVCVPEEFPQHYRPLFDRLPVHRVLLIPRREALVHRLQSRGGGFDEVILQHLPWIYEVVARLELRGWTVFNPSDWSVEHTADAVMESWRGADAAQSR